MVEPLQRTRDVFCFESGRWVVLGTHAGNEHVRAEHARGTYIMDGTIARTFLATLNAGGGFAGYTDWRIPNYKELFSILNLENVTPAVSPAFNTGCTAGCTVTSCSCTQRGSYWSSTTTRGTPDSAWHVDFFFGYVLYNSKGNGSYVRAVRNGL